MNSAVFTHQAPALGNQQALTNPFFHSAASSGEFEHHYAKAKSRQVSPYSLGMGKPQPEQRGCKQLSDRGKVQ